MNKFDSYKILESTRETLSKTHSSHKDFLQSIIDKAKKKNQQPVDDKKDHK